MDSSFWFDAISLGWPIVYTEGSQVIISTQKCISFAEDCFCHSKNLTFSFVVYFSKFSSDQAVSHK